MKRFLETGNFAITEGAILAGCRFFAGYPITPATELAEAMSLRLPLEGGFYLQAEDECAAMHLCIGASLGGFKVMTATSGPGFILYADPYGWALGCETPMVVLNSGRVGPVRFRIAGHPPLTRNSTPAPDPHGWPAPPVSPWPAVPLRP